MTTPDITVQITADTAGARAAIARAGAALRTITTSVAALGPAVAKAAALGRDDFALWPPARAPHGPGAARQVAEQIAATGAVSCLIADGGHVCLGRPCNAPAPTLAEVLL